MIGLTYNAWATSGSGTWLTTSQPCGLHPSFSASFGDMSRIEVSYFMSDEKETFRISYSLQLFSLNHGRCNFALIINSNLVLTPWLNGDVSLHNHNNTIRSQQIGQGKTYIQDLVLHSK